MIPMYRYEYTTVRSDLGLVETKLVLRSFVVMQTTPKGFWVEEESGFRRWVCDGGAKPWAHRTKRQALLAMRERTERRVNILQVQLKACKEALVLADRILGTVSAGVVNDGD